jgi:hypothetical protein
VVAGLAGELALPADAALVGGPAADGEEHAVQVVDDGGRGHAELGQHLAGAGEGIFRQPRDVGTEALDALELGGAADQRRLAPGLVERQVAPRQGPGGLVVVVVGAGPARDGINDPG